MRRLLPALALLAPLTPLAAAAGPLFCGPDFSSDCDGIPDALDNCVDVANAPPLDCDSDGDGYGNLCDGDFNNDMIVGGPDFGAFGGPETANSGTDMNCDGIVGGPDFGLFSADFGGEPGPSGLYCAGTPPCP